MAEHLIRLSVPAMGSVFELYLGGDDAAELERMGHLALERVRALEARLSHFKPDSLLSRLNTCAFRAPVPLDDEMFALCSRLLQLWEETEGAFDPTVGKLIKEWGMFRQGSLLDETVAPPNRDKIAHIAQEIGGNQVELNPKTQTIRFLSTWVELHLGAVGKGYIVQQTADFLREAGISCALLHSGYSSVAAVGAPPESAGWEVGVAHPYDDLETCASLTLRDAALSTSSSLEGVRTTKGEEIPHIFDPRTGEPIVYRGSISVLSPDATAGDALATAFCVQGQNWTEAYCAKHPELQVLFLEAKTAQETPRSVWIGERS